EQKIAFRGNSKPPRNIDDAPRLLVEGDLKRAAARSQDHRHFVLFFEMKIDRALDRQVGENVAVVNNERFIVQQILHVFYSAAGLQQRALLAEIKARTAIIRAGKFLRVTLRTMMRIHRDFRDSVPQQMVECKRDQRFLADW